MFARRGQFIFALIVGALGAVLVYTAYRNADRRARQRYARQRPFSSRSPDALPKEQVAKIRASLGPDETVCTLTVEVDTPLEPWITPGDRADVYAESDSLQPLTKGALVVGIRGSPEAYRARGEVLHHRSVDVVAPKAVVPRLLQAARAGQLDFVLSVPKESAESPAPEAATPKADPASEGSN